MEYSVLPQLHVKQSETHGLGVFAREKIAADTVIERSAVLQSMYRRTSGRPCAFAKYLYYGWEDYPDVGMIVTGYGSMYNDAGMCCNVVWDLDINNRCMTYTAIRDIEVHYLCTVVFITRRG
eukprot:COSAG02_NODE_9663_length_2148_cov_3.258122_2_plen_122_part_00